MLFRKIKLFAMPRYYSKAANNKVILISRILHYKFVTENAPIRTHPKLEARKESKVFDKTVEI